MKRSFFGRAVAGACLQLVVAAASGVFAAERPNILWLSCEDISANLGCYGDPFATTPNLDWVVESRDLGLVPEAEIAARERQLGSAWAILSGPDAGDLIQRLRNAASLSLEGAERIPKLLEALQDSDDVVR